MNDNINELINNREDLLGELINKMTISTNNYLNAIQISEESKNTKELLNNYYRKSNKGEGEGKDKLKIQCYCNICIVNIM